MAMHTELWFPSVIWSSVIHIVDNDKVKSFAYNKQKENKGRTISNFGGFQSQDIKSGECHAVDRLVKLLNDEMNTCANQVGMKNDEMVFIKCRFIFYGEFFLKILLFLSWDLSPSILDLSNS